MAKRHSGIYCIIVHRNGKSPKYYIGQSCVMRERWNQHIRQLRNGVAKNPALQAAFHKYGEDAFSFTLLVTCTEDKLLLAKLEKFFFDEFSKIYGEDSMYNVNRESMTSAAGVKRSPQALENLRAAAKKRTMTEEHKERLRQISKLRIGSKLSPETIAKRTESQKGVKRTEEWKSYMSKVMTGRKHSDETKAKISAKKKAAGIKLTEEHMEKLRIANTGRIFSEETKLKISMSKIGKSKSPEEIERRTATRRANALLKNKAY